MNEYKDLERLACEIRILALKGIYEAQSGHIGGSFSICEILTILFFKQMRIQSDQLNNLNRDRFILSKGHAAPAYYATLALKGFFPKAEMLKLRKIDSFLQGHPCVLKVPGVDMSTGSLGQGLSIANGMALMGKADNRDYHVFCLCGDGELQEGQIWEAMMSAAHYMLNNLTLFVDCNGLQIDGNVNEVMNVAPLNAKFKAFGWNVLEVDGHNLAAIDEAINQAKKQKRKPSVILAQTIKGKGVSFMENQAGWHGVAPNETQYKQALEELECSWKESV